MSFGLGNEVKRTVLGRQTLHKGSAENRSKKVGAESEDGAQRQCLKTKLVRRAVLRGNKVHRGCA